MTYSASARSSALLRVLQPQLDVQPALEPNPPPLLSSSAPFPGFLPSRPPTNSRSHSAWRMHPKDFPSRRLRTIRTAGCARYFPTPRLDVQSRNIQQSRLDSVLSTPSPLHIPTLSIQRGARDVVRRRRRDCDASNVASLWGRLIALRLPGVACPTLGGLLRFSRSRFNGWTTDLYRPCDSASSLAEARAFTVLAIPPHLWQ
ncbi:hypothetical protein NUW54_g12160 [Trametes sanguinea]|uniref:Uncharacterized protein n=1 Tax=Trametes sanguinea TaxID=158606 RepID=A0ACC1N224_9APHY|nr:hypothetical protein NUW54_g12160 [Trametes sanguinea]